MNFLGCPILLGARPVLSMSFHIPDSPGRVPYEENEFVCLIRGGACVHFRPPNPACSSEILLQRVSDPFAFREVISYEIPLQRVLTRLPFLLRLLHLFVIVVDLELLDVQSVLFHLRNVSAVRFLGLSARLPFM